MILGHKQRCNKWGIRCNLDPDGLGRTRMDQDGPRRTEALWQLLWILENTELRIYRRRLIYSNSFEIFSQKIFGMAMLCICKPPKFLLLNFFKGWNTNASLVEFSPQIYVYSKVQKIVCIFRKYSNLKKNQARQDISFWKLFIFINF